jgi:ParB-like chromosome segregation protein Spo0J
MSTEQIKSAIQAFIASRPDKIRAIEEVKELIHSMSPLAHQPINLVRWVPVESLEPNDYNPNSVAGKEMSLLYTSIKQDGYTQPVVTIWDDTKKKFIIVDGFHRYFICKNQKDIRERNGGMLPIVVIDKSINERMAATVRHNRARGEHSINGMSSLVFGMLENGWSDAQICNHIGLEPDELLKLKHLTGFSALFKNTQYRKAWETKNQIKLRLEHGQSEGH